MKKTLWTKNFTTITLGTIVSSIGSTALNLVLSFVVFSNTESTFLFSIFSAISLIPNLLLPLLLSAYIDRIPRKPIIVFLDFLNGCTMFLFGYFILKYGFNFNMFLTFSLIESCISSVYSISYQSLYPKFDMSQVKELAAVLHLDLHRSIDTFSKGMKRQCALICAIATNAKYMFFDETFDGLDPVVRNFMKKKLMEQMTKQDTTIIMTSHNLRELEDICDHLGLLYQGGILFESEIDTLKTNMYKVQIGFSTAFDEQKFAKFDVLNYKKNGSVATLILKGNEKSLKAELEKMKPLLLDFLPLTLEEIFIYEMEALGYEFEEMVAR